MIDGEEQHGFQELRLQDGSSDRDDGFAREDRGPLRHGPYVAGEMKMPEIFQKFRRENLFGGEEFDVLLGKMQILDIRNHLLQPGKDGEAALVGHVAEEHVEIGDTVADAVFEISVHHGHFVIIEKHCEIKAGNKLVHGGMTPFSI